MINQVNQSVENYRSARNSAAIGEGFIPEYVDFRGIRIYYQTVSHAWVIPIVSARLQNASVFEKGMLTIYILAAPPEEARNRIMRELADGVVLERAVEFFASHGISPDDLEDLDPEKLLRHPYENPPKPGPPPAPSSTTTGGAV